MKGMKKFRKALALLLALVMSLSITMVPSFADSSVTDKPEGAQFLSFTGDGEGAITMTPDGTVDNWGEAVPAYHVFVPEGTTTVTVSYPKSVLRFDNWNPDKIILCRFEERSMAGNIDATPEIDGDVAKVTLTVADWLDTNNKAIACQDGTTYLGIEAFTFEYYTPAEEPAGINLKVTAGTEETLKAGDELTAVLTVPAPADPFAACNVQMNFNKDILEADEISLAGITATSVTEKDAANESGKVAAVYAGTTDITQTDDIVLTVKFKIKEGVYEDDYEDLIEVNTEETYFTNADDEDLTVVFDEDAISYDAHIEGLYKIKIPEGCPFTDVTTDVEGGRVTIKNIGSDTGTVWGMTVVADPLYLFTCDAAITTLYITVPLSKVYFAPGYNDQRLEGCCKTGGSGFNGCTHSEVDGVKYITFPVTVRSWLHDDDKWCAPYNTGMQPLCGITTDIYCPHEHVVKTEAKEATCDEAGNTAYWYCEDCERYYSDEELTHLIKNLDDTVIKALGHTFGEDGLCIRCGLRGDATVVFSGDAVERVTEKSKEKENAGQDFTFKADNAVVSTMAGALIDIPEIEIGGWWGDPDPCVFADSGTVEKDGITVPNYTAYINGRCMLNGVTVDEDESDRYDWYDCYQLYNENGNRANIYCGNLNNFNGEGQYYVYRDYNVGVDWDPDGYYNDYEVTSHVLAFGLNVKKSAAPEPTLTKIEPDDNGVYTIPASQMKAGMKVYISVEKPADEKVMALIDAIGEVTLEKEAAITAAREGYDALSDQEKADFPLDYKFKLIEAELKLEKLKNEKLEQEAAANKAELEQAIADAKAELNTQITELQNQITALQEADAAQIAALQQQIADLQAALDELGEAAATKEELEEQVSSLTDQITALTTEINNIKTQAATDKAALEKALTDAKAELSAQITELEDEITELKAADATSKEQIEELEGQITALQSALDELSDAAATKEELETQVSALNKTIEGLNKEITDIKAQAAADKAALEKELKETKEALETQISVLEGEIDTLTKNAETDETTINDLKAQITTLQQTVKDLGEAAATKEELLAQIQTLNTTITGLNSQIADMKAAQGTDKALDEKKALAADEINKYLEDNLDNILAADKVEAELAALQNILKANSAKDQAGIDAAVAAAKAVIDEKVQIKADTDAAKALKVSGLKAKPKKLKFTVSWKKNADADSYQVQYKMKGAKKFSSLKKSVAKVSVKSKALKKGKKYIFRVRTIKTVNGKKVYGKWVKTKAVKCK